MSKRAKQTIVVADHTQIGCPGFTHVRDAGPEVYLVTSSQAPAADRKTLEAAGVRIILC